MLAMMLLIACLVVAGWPLFTHPRIRPLLTGAAGSTCMLIGATTAGLTAGGIFQLPALTGELYAFDNHPAVERAADLPATESSATESSATESSAPKLSTPKAADPQIESTSPDQVVIPPGRPEWVEKEPNLNGAVHTIAVSSGPFKTETECRRALDKELVKATRNYIVEQLGSDLAAQFIQYDARTIRQRLLKPSNIYNEEITVSFGPMHQTHAVLEFDSKFRKQLSTRWDKVRGASRLTQAGLFAGAALLLVGSIFGYFRTDNATRGYYTGRLQFMTAAAILAILSAGVVVARFITWL